MPPNDKPPQWFLDRIPLTGHYITVGNQPCKANKMESASAFPKESL